MFNDKVLNLISEIIPKTGVYLVGGYIRNYYINNKISQDRDIVCLEGAFELAQKIASELKGTFIELDSENKIYRVVLKNKTDYFDIAEAYKNDITLDAKRRDFTINSVFYDLNKKEIFDPLKGIEDIKNKIIRCVDFKNLTDDPLRLLRMYRFFSMTGYKIDDELSEFTKKNFNLIKNVAPERINAEIIHIFEGEYVVETLLKMFDDGALEKVFPFVNEIKRVPPNSHHHLDLVHHSIETVKNIRINKPLLKIAAFYHDIGKPSTWTIEPKGRHRFIGHDIKGSEIAKEELRTLKFSKKQISYISDMIKYHIYPASLINSDESKKAYARFIRRLNENVEDIIELSRADRLSALGEAVTKETVENTLNHLENLLKYYNEVKSLSVAPKPLIDGNGVLKILSIKPSPLVGRILEALIEAQIAKTVTNKDEAVEFIKNFNKKSFDK